MTSPFRTLPGAVVDEGADSPAHYGDPMREQRALASGRALVDLGDRAIIEAAGADRLTWLDSITSQAVTQLAPGESAELLILDPNGRIEHAAAIVDDGVSAWLIADSADAEPLLAWLKRMVFRAQVKLSPRDDLAIVGAEFGGPAAQALAAAAHSPADVPLVWRDPWIGVAAGGHQYAQTEPHPGTRRDWIEAIVDADARARLAQAATGELAAAGLLAAEARRIEAWRPRWSREVDERAIPHELDWMRTSVHLNKGCYRGQETVAKVHNLGHPPRRLVFLHLDGALAAPGAVVRAGDREVGVVTSSAFHHELGPIALAVIKRATPVDAALEVQADDGWLAAAQEVIVPPTAGAEASVPRLPRLSARR